MSLHLTHRHPPPPQTTPMPTKPVPVRPPPLPPSNRLLLQTGCPAGPPTGVVVRDSVLADLPESGFSQVPSPNRLKLDYFRAVSSETMAADYLDYEDYEKDYPSYEKDYLNFEDYVDYVDSVDNEDFDDDYYEDNDRGSQ